MKTKYLILFFAICFNYQYVVAQQKTGQNAIDSLLTVLPTLKLDSAKVATLILIAEEYKFIKPDLGIVYGNKALIIAKKTKWNDGIALSLKSLGMNYERIGNIQKANLLFDTSFRYTKNKIYISLLYIEKGNLELTKANHSKAL
jgi:hypothetical protein